MYATIFGNWAMVDVFGLALFVFMTESGSLISTQSLRGFYIVIAATIFQSVVRIFSKCVVNHDKAEIFSNKTD